MVVIIYIKVSNHPLYTLNLYNVTCQLHLSNEKGEERGRKEEKERFTRRLSDDIFSYLKSSFELQQCAQTALTIRFP